MKFQTKQPQRLLKNGRIVSSIDPRDHDTLKAWFFAQTWIGYCLAALVWAGGISVVLALIYGARLLREYLISLL
jgi:hypothetical protein